MNGWRTNASIPGGFIWRLDSMTEGGHTVRDYAAAIDGNYSQSIDAAKYHRIMNRHSGKALMVCDETLAGLPGDAMADSANIAQGIYNGSNPRFHWRIEDVGSGFRKITSRHSGKSMAVFAVHLDGSVRCEGSGAGRPPNAVRCGAILSWPARVTPALMVRRSTGLTCPHFT